MEENMVDTDQIPANWTDEGSGLRCAIVRGPMDTLNGYVAVGPDHPWFGKGYSEHLPMRCEKIEEDGGYCYDHAPDALTSVHGGLTYAGEGVRGADQSEGLWWFGFDTAHAGDFVPRLGTSFPGDAVRDFGYVKAEVESLAKQLAAAGGDRG